MHIVAVPGRLVRDPATRRVVDAAGITIDPTDPYWRRMLADGDVEEGEDSQPDIPTPLKPAPAPVAKASTSQENPA